MVYNPNIHPYREYLTRMDTLEFFCKKEDIPTVKIEPDYYSYFRKISVSEKSRCEECYMLRLGKTAQIASELDFPSFTTTLLVSPYQKHDKIKEVGLIMGEKHGVLFHYDDYREGYYNAVDISRKLGMYRQKYCGCIFSEKESHQGKKKRAS